MTARPARGLLDTSVLIAAEDGRRLAVDRPPDESAVSAITVGELHAGVLAAQDLDTRARRLATLDAVADMELLPIDDQVAAAWGRLRVHLAQSGRRLTSTISGSPRPRSPTDCPSSRRTTTSDRSTASPG